MRLHRHRRTDVVARHRRRQEHRRSAPRSCPTPSMRSTRSASAGRVSRQSASSRSSAVRCSAAPSPSQPRSRTRRTIASPQPTHRRTSSSAAPEPAAASTTSPANYANNVAPDVIVKVAFDSAARPLRGRRTRRASIVTASTRSPHPPPPRRRWRHHHHLPVARSELHRNRRRRIRQCPRPNTKFVDVAVQGMFGDGTGRYGSSQLADLTVHPDGTLEPMRNVPRVCSRSKPTPAKKLDVYAYSGGEYAQRTLYISPSRRSRSATAHAPSTTRAATPTPRPPPASAPPA